jgi:hypothetical protein
MLADEFDTCAWSGRLPKSGAPGPGANQRWAARLNPSHPSRTPHMLATALIRSLRCAGQLPTPRRSKRRSENSIYLVNRERLDVMMPTHGMRNPFCVDALAGRVSTGGAGGAERSFAGWQGHMLADFLLLHVCDCGHAQFYLGPCLGCRCMPSLHVAVPLRGGVGQLWSWGGSVLLAACLSTQNGTARARQTSEFWHCVWGTVSVMRRLHLQVESLCMFLCCFALSKPFALTCIIPICAARGLKIIITPPTGAPPHPTESLD